VQKNLGTQGKSGLATKRKSAESRNGDSGFPETPEPRSAELGRQHEEMLMSPDGEAPFEVQASPAGGMYF
jgi:hypothetical protein